MECEKDRAKIWGGLAHREERAMKKIIVTLDVPDGQSCRINEPMKVGLCRYYRSRSCVVFNAVIVDFIKSKKCQAS